ncbi:NAD(P)/FAD-dependent oxidoreductase [Homoserinimonas sp. OAct 916]|uniref:phytoene desaturase family protein n=1 Tax=Homoserinimonas sp. OAct 916 TaxID=2211450 RepID=UPI000DBE32C7|nr:NAD(P)/FAD-dependent oxidoreductase [Homoserinimonas sp. OAct 916]
MTKTSPDVVIVGGGHNGLAAAAYLAQAGKNVLLLERDDHTGGAAVSAWAFEGVDARLSRYSYLVSLLPKRIIEDLKLDVELARRRYSSYTPDPGHPGTGLLVDHGDDDATQDSFIRVGAAEDIEAWHAFYSDTARVAQALFPTVLEPLPTRSEVRRLLADDALFAALFERPLGETITARFTNDLVRGVVLTDGLIGTFTSADDPSLDANRCFLYHVIGNQTGDWDVPVGGMGAVTGALANAATEAGATLVTDATVTRVTPDGHVRYTLDGVEHEVTARHVLANVAPYILEQLLAEGAANEPSPAEASGADASAIVRPEGAQVKVNLMLKRLPRLLDTTVAPEAAFGGTFHINETYTQLQTAHDEAEAGGIPRLLPCEIYCHSLTDPSILSPELAASGAHTLTVFGLHAPDRLLTAENNDHMRARYQQAVLDSLNSVLAEPIEDVLMTDAHGELCIETKTTLDIEEALNMPGGNIFHGPLDWPFAEDDARLETPAERWGVATRHPRILLCGSGAVRGGAVSAIAGHNAAMAVLES